MAKYLVTIVIGDEGDQLGVPFFRGVEAESEGEAKRIAEETWGVARVLEVEGVDELLEWPCQDFHGAGEGYKGQEMCRHEECHPRNNDK